MKKITKILSIFLAAVCLTFCFSSNITTVTAAPKDPYKPYPLKSENMLYPSHYYDNAEMTGEPILHSFIKISSGYPGFACDNNRGSGLTGKPIKFKELYDSYVANGSTGNVKVPCCVIDLALGGDPVEIAAFSLSLRSSFDCEPLHIKIQVTTEANSSNWITVYEESNIFWDNITKRWTFDPVNAYQVRIVVLDLDEVDIEAEGDYYDKILGDETRFAYSEVDVYTLEGELEPTDPTQPSTQKPTDPTQKPTDPTQKPTDPTEGGSTPTTDPTEAPTDAVDPTEAPTDAVEPTEEPTSPENPTEPSIEPTEEPTVGPTDPTEEPTVAPTEAPTDAPTEAPTDGATQAPTDSPAADKGTAEPKNSTGLIIGIVAAVVVIGAVVFVVLKKKK